MRVGNANPDSYFIGPELPGYGLLGESPDTIAPPYKVGELIRPQAARFRIFEYRKQTDGNWLPVQEVNLSTAGVAEPRYPSQRLTSNRDPGSHARNRNGPVPRIFCLKVISTPRSPLVANVRPMSVIPSRAGPAVLTKR